MPNESELKIFLSLAGDEQQSVRTELAQVLVSAGMMVAPQQQQFSESEKSKLVQPISESNCSVHILFPQYSPVLNDGISLAKFQFEEAKKQLEQNAAFRLFVWMPPTTNF